MGMPQLGRFLVALLVLGCQGKGDDTGAASVTAIVDPQRSEHFLDWPFPSNEMLDSRGVVSLDGFPIPEPPLSAGLIESWVERIESATLGFGNNTAAYFRFEGPLVLLPQLAGVQGDPVVWIDVDTGEQLPVELRFIEDPSGDPFYGPNTMAVAPVVGRPMQSGHTYAVVVMESAGVVAPSGYTHPPGVQDALAAAGIDAASAVGTVFTTQDATGMLRELAEDVAGRLTTPSLDFQEVTELSYTLGQTPSGIEAVAATTTFVDGTTRTVWMEAGADFVDHTIDLVDWPMVVYEADLPVWNYQGLEDRPYMSPGLAHIGDLDVQTGWITRDGVVISREPEAEMMRITLSMPRVQGVAGDAKGVVVHDHGTGGHAYNVLARINAQDNPRQIQEVFAEEGWAVIGRDASLYGARYPLIDEGYGASLGFYNIVNAPAFRDNQRQTAVDGQVLLHYIRQGLEADLPGGSVDTSRIRRTGHSLGSVTANLGSAMDPDGVEAVFITGSGGIFSLYFLETGLLDDIGNDLVETLFALVGAEVPESITTEAALGAILGLEEEAWSHLDRLHPSISLFQWMMDPSDPMAVAKDESLPVHALVAPGDYQTPAFTAYGLVEALPEGTQSTCEALADYDPHYCYWREQAGADAIREWLQTEL